MAEPTNTPQDGVQPTERSTQRPADASNTARPPAQDTAADGGFDLNQPTIISLCYLASFITGISGLVGIVLAHIWQDEAADWAKSHYTYLIRTFWFGLIGMVVGIILTMVLIGILVIIAVSVWVAVRSVMSLIRAQKHEPMPNPKTLGI